jgi:hypothetical protein
MCALEGEGWIHFISANPFKGEHSQHDWRPEILRHFDEQDLDIFHLDFGGLAAPATLLKCPRKRQSSPQLAYERSKEYELA